MSFRVISLCAISASLIGCGRTSISPPAPTSGSNQAGEKPVESPEADLASILAELTQTLRKYSVEQRRVPASLNELVSAGYLKDMPQSPSGKTFSIDPQKLQVVLK